MGVFSLFTYLRPFLEVKTKLDVEVISLALLALGVAGLIGTFIIGNLLKTKLFSLLIIIPFLMMFLAIGFILFGNSVTWVFILISLWGLFATSAPVAWWTWLSQTLPNDAEAGGGLMVAVIQLSITLGAALGGLLFDAYGYEITFVFSAIILSISAIISSITAFYTVKNR
jgi:DHA1 family purine ribonucleoside efflux pump-like MFS transporter